MRFKSEVFAILANVAWTYLLHEYYERKKVKIVDDNGRSLLLSQMLKRNDCPLSDGIKNNLRSLINLRNEVEHKLLGHADVKWLGLFQACCLNFDKVICKLFGDRLTLSHDLSFAIQFTKMNLEQLSALNPYEIPAHIDAIDARLTEGMTEEQINDLEYQFRVVFTLDAAAKSRAHFQFISPDSAEGKEIRNVLVKYKPADHLYPHKPGAVVSQVCQKTGKPFTIYNHTQAWHKFGVRPRNGAPHPENTNRDYCIYHPVHKDYTYSNRWIERLVAEVSDDQKYAALIAFKGEINLIEFPRHSRAKRLYRQVKAAEISRRCKFRA
ncbi:MAG: DUF3644 domain-containing protein [Acidobacteriia bacterium]|nr:DUF3644 domain-containing protein [Methyloceanibacter sp.]MBX5471555.1 DUF3644 domain-containing protein [Acetobacteraceae bacterium]MCL6492348.1 DUF3644 domain-containing protein [Terriglobia bacterium]